MKKMLLIFTKIAVALLLFILGYVLLVLLIPYISVNKAKTSTSEDVTIYIKTNGDHTDIVVPIETGYKNWSETVKRSRIKSKDSIMRYIGYGWGDKKFYLNTIGLI
jgi:hypothetical protein